MRAPIHTDRPNSNSSDSSNQAHTLSLSPRYVNKYGYALHHSYQWARFRAQRQTRTCDNTHAKLPMFWRRPIPKILSPHRLLMKSAFDSIQLILVHHFSFLISWFGREAITFQFEMESNAGPAFVLKFHRFIARWTNNGNFQRIF